ncbi:MAG TPA: universal stress protein [Solirubrobacteraceae bacterium]|nr:universal stress protein [Solirubrobacteraceae bacterium]
MFTTLVVGIDGADGGRDALELAHALAGEHSDVILVTVVPDQTTPIRASDGAYTKLVRDDARTRLESVAATDPRYRSWVAGDSSPARALHDVAAETNADLIVVGSAHRGAIGRILLGDVSRSVLHGAPCTVAVAPRGFHAHPHTSIATIGVGVNSTRESDAALALAAELAEEAGASLRLLTAVAIPTAMAPAYAYAYNWTDIEADNRTFAEQHLTELKGSLNVPADTVVVSANAAIALEELSGDVDVIVAGSRGWGAAKVVVLGSTTDRLVHHAHCPVLVVPGPVAARQPEEAVHA